MKETVHINGKRVHPCEHCGLACIEQYYVKSPCLDFPDREIKMYLCYFCHRNLELSGIQTRKVKD